jgi:hypothetical protein
VDSLGPVVDALGLGSEVDSIAKEDKGSLLMRVAQRPSELSLPFSTMIIRVGFKRMMAMNRADFKHLLEDM